MANRIQGITVEIGGDTTKLTTALKGINSEIRNTQSQLKDVEKLLKLDPHNTELLAQKQRFLKDVIGETKEKLDALKTAQQQVQQQFE
ncbi:MAG TPA: phage tail tape measure protein, partial [Lachnoclostridium sp.]|nr:phage tail tape measure protein [Lachnoclostridium sp.]